MTEKSFIKGTTETTVSRITQLALRLYHDMVRDSITTPEAISALLDRLDPTLSPDERRAVLGLAVNLAGYVASALNDAAFTARTGSDWYGTILALETQDNWVVQDLRVCLGEVSEDPTKEATRKGEIEALSAAVKGANPAFFGRLFREQITRSPQGNQPSS